MMNRFSPSLSDLVERGGSLVRQSRLLIIRHHLGRLFLSLPLALSFLVLVGGQTAFAATQRATAAATQQTIVWIGDQGKVVRVWSGSNSDAQVIKTNELARLAKLHAKHPLVTPPRSSSQTANAVSPNIDRVSDSACGSDIGNTYFKLWNNESGDAHGVCFATAGDASINVYDVTLITTGNNEGNFVYHENDLDITYPIPGDGDQICKQVSLIALTSDGYFDDVTNVGITAPTAPCERLS